MFDRGPKLRVLALTALLSTACATTSTGCGEQDEPKVMPRGQPEPEATTRGEPESAQEARLLVEFWEDIPAELNDEVIRVLKERVESEDLPSLRWRPLGGNRFEVRMPRADAELDPVEWKRRITRAGVLEFRIAPYSPYKSAELLQDVEQVERYRRVLRNSGPRGLKKSDTYLWFPIEGDAQRFRGQNLILGEGPAGKKYLLMSNQPADMMLQQPGQSGWELKRAYPTQDQVGGPAIGFEFKEKGARMFARLTARHKATEGRPGHALGILVDDRVYSAPAIREVVSGQGIITGDFTPDEVNVLVRRLNAGRLPAKIRRVRIEPAAAPPEAPATQPGSSADGR